MAKTKRQRTYLRDSDSNDEEEDNAILFKKLLEEKHKKARSDALKKADQLIGDAVDGMNALRDKYRHAVEVTHKEQLDNRYARLLADLAPHDATIASAWATVLACSSELQALIDRGVRDMDKSADKERQVAKGCQVVIDEAVRDENTAREKLK